MVMQHSPAATAAAAHPSGHHHTPLHNRPINHGHHLHHLLVTSNRQQAQQGPNAPVLPTLSQQIYSTSPYQYHSRANYAAGGNIGPTAQGSTYNAHLLPGNVNLNPGTFYQRYPTRHHHHRSLESYHRGTNGVNSDTEVPHPPPPANHSSSTSLTPPANCNSNGNEHNISTTAPSQSIYHHRHHHPPHRSLHRLDSFLDENIHKVSPIFCL